MILLGTGCIFMALAIVFWLQLRSCFALDEACCAYVLFCSSAATIIFSLDRNLDLAIVAQFIAAVAAVETYIVSLNINKKH